MRKQKIKMQRPLQRKEGQGRWGGRGWGCSPLYYANTIRVHLIRCSVLNCCNRRFQHLKRSNKTAARKLLLLRDTESLPSFGGEKKKPLLCAFFPPQREACWHFKAVRALETKRFISRIHSFAIWLQSTRRLKKKNAHKLLLVKKKRKSLVWKKNREPVIDCVLITGRKNKMAFFFSAWAQLGPSQVWHSDILRAHHEQLMQQITTFFDRGIKYVDCLRASMNKLSLETLNLKIDGFPSRPELCKTVVALTLRWWWQTGSVHFK